MLSNHNQPPQTERQAIVANTEPSNETQLIRTNNYSFQAPLSWRESRTRNNDCEWLTIANDSADGMRMAGEISIYPVRCFEIADTPSYKQFVELDGYYIIEYSDPEIGTTEAEAEETARAYQLVVGTFVGN